MNRDGALSVIVHIHGPRDFSWTLLRRRYSTDLSERVSASPDRFSDYDLAMDAGFAALHRYRLGEALRSRREASIVDQLRAEQDNLPLADDLRRQ